MMKASLFTINSKVIGAALVAICAISLSGCGKSADVKMIEKDDNKESSVSVSTENVKENKESETVSEEITEDTKEAPEGFYFTVDDLYITTDVPANEYVEALPEAVSYFEAASCAFEGLDKYYTYDHFEIDTYPSGDDDYIASIVLTDDIVETSEGISIGMTKDDVVSVYGDDFEGIGSGMVYTKGTTNLSFILDGNVIISISYDSTIMQEATAE